MENIIHSKLSIYIKLKILNEKGLTKYFSLVAKIGGVCILKTNE